MSQIKNYLRIGLAFLLYPALLCALENGKYEPGEAISPGVLPSAYMAPGRVDVAGYWDFAIQGSFLYWQAKESGLDFGYVVPLDPGTHRGARLDKHFNYHPGFQISVSTDLHHDGWECGLDYTYLHTTEAIHSGIPDWSGGIEPTWLSPINGPATSSITFAEANWKFKFDMIDLELSRPSYFGTSLIMNPLFGFRGGWIRQQYKVNYTLNNIGVVPVKSYQHSYLIGPRFGFGGKILLGRGFRLNGSSFVSLLFEDVKVTLKRQSFVNPSIVLTNVKNKQRLFIPNLDLSLGLGWGTYYCHEKYYFDLSLNFDIQYYWNQNWMRSLKDVTDVRVDSLADLRLQGLTGNIGFYF